MYTVNNKKNMRCQVHPPDIILVQKYEIIRPKPVNKTFITSIHKNFTKNMGR